jgi:hypothetical protein
MKKRTKPGLPLNHVVGILGVCFFLVGVFLGVQYFVHAAALTGTDVQPLSLVAGDTTNVTVAFHTSSPIPPAGKVVVTFPARFLVSGITSAACSSMDGTFAVSMIGQNVTITRQGDGTPQMADDEACTITSVVNPSIAGTTGVYGITTRTAVGGLLDTDAAVPGDIIVSAPLTQTNAHLAPARVGVSGVLVALFGTANPIENDGRINITFPVGFDVSAVTNASCSSMDGEFLTSVDGQVVTITRSGGTISLPQAQTCIIRNVSNPVSVGLYGPFVFSTTNSIGALHDRDLAVPGVAVLGASSGGFVPDVPARFSVSLTVLTPDANVSVGEDTSITWSYRGPTLLVPLATLSYSEDGGGSWQEIVADQTNTGTYAWDVPAEIAVKTIIIKVDIFDKEKFITSGQSGLLAVDRSAASEEAIPVSQGSSSADEVAMPEGDNTSPAEGDSVAEEPANVADETSVTEPVVYGPDLYIRGTSSSTVYALSGDGLRHVFWNAQILATYGVELGDVVQLSDEQLSLHALGEPRLPKAGTVLVKVPSSERVYAIGDDSELHWLTSQSVAASFYGKRWSDYVIDIPETGWLAFTVGTDITASSNWTVDTAALLTRDELNSH